MTGDLNFGGVYFPALLLLGVVAVGLTGLLSRFINLAGGYRLVVYRPLVDLAIFILMLGLLVLLTAPKGTGL